MGNTVKRSTDEKKITLRPATASDQEPLGRYGAALMRQHHAADPGRFILVEHPDADYGRFLVSRITNPSSLVLVFEGEGAVLGYVYADVARHLGAGRMLLGAAIEWIRSKGRSQVVLMTKSRNEHAHHLFAALGFRPTMIEMTLDLGPKGEN